MTSWLPTSSEIRNLVPGPLGLAHITTFFPFRNLLSLYGVWESAQLLRDWSVRTLTISFLHLYQGNRGHTLSSPWVRRVGFSTLAITDLLPLCSHFTRIQLVSLENHVLNWFSHSRASRLDSLALQSYSDFAMISDYAIICFADPYFFLLVFLG